MTLNTKPGPDAKTTLPILTGISDILTRQTTLRGDKTALIFEGQSLTYEALDAGANKTANGLLSLDVIRNCLLYTSPSPRDLSTSRMPSSA